MKPLLGQARSGITIVNRKNGYVRGHYVGRGSVLGSPYRLVANAPQEVLEQYREWLRREFKQGGTVRRALMGLAREYVEAGTLTLVCNCAPKRCHASVIQEAILGIVRKGSGKPATQSVACAGDPQTTT